MTASFELPSPEKVKAKFTLSHDDFESIRSFRHTICQIISRKTNKKTLIFGPCSVHNTDELLSYAKRFLQLQKKLEKHFFCVLRVYIEKPRTCLGWKGLLYDPDLDGSYNLEKGLYKCREMFCELVKMKVPLAIEFLEPNVAIYFEDLISWGSVGARTTPSQVHRQMASHLACPIGFKNTIDGNIDTVCSSIVAASQPQTFFGISQVGQLSRIQSLGNPYCHLVLRGAEHKPNYSVSSIQNAITKLINFSIEPSLILDCAHGNSQKTLSGQVKAFEQIISYWEKGYQYIVGVMLESYMKSGNQPLHYDVTLQKGLSITDPCLSYEQTEQLLFKAYESLEKMQIEQKIYSVSNT